MKRIFVFFLASVLVLGGCASKIDQVNRETETGQVQDDNVALIQQQKQAKVMNEYQQLLNDKKTPEELIEFVTVNIKNVDRESADKLVRGLITAQLEQLSIYEKDILSDDINPKMNSYTYEDLLNMQNIKEEAIRNSLKKAFDNWYRLSTAEGMYFIEANYDKFHKEFGGYTTEKMTEFLRIMAIENVRHFQKDAAIVIELDELANRIVDAEKFIDKYSEASESKEMNGLYLRYLKAYLIGSNNTPAFDYSTNKLRQKFLESYRSSLETYKNTRIESILKEYLILLEKNSYKKTDEILRFVEYNTQSGC